MEEVDDIFGHTLYTFMFIRYFHGVLVFLCLERVGQTTMLIMNGFRVRLPVDWSINDQSSPYGRKRGSGCLGAGVGVLMVYTWFYMWYYPYSRRDLVFYLYICGTVGIPFAFWYDEGGMVCV